jgi:hypothetical protein
MTSDERMRLKPSTLEMRAESEPAIQASAQAPSTSQADDPEAS